MKEIMFQDLVDLFGSPQVNLFASTSNHKLSLFVSHWMAMEALGLDTFLVSWSRWNFLYLFSPLAARVLLQVWNKL